MNTKASTIEPVYWDFEPFCKSRVEEQRHIFEVELPGFKKEDLKFQIIPEEKGSGFLQITGECKLDGGEGRRLCKKFKVPVDCDPEEMWAMFEDGLLTITMSPQGTRSPELEEPKQEIGTVKPVLNNPNCLKIAVPVLAMLIAVAVRWLLMEKKLN